MDISTNGDAMDNVQETRISLHHKDIIIVPEKEKSEVKQKYVNFEEPQKFIDEMKTAIQCWAGMKVTRYLLFIKTTYKFCKRYNLLLGSSRSIAFS